MSVPHPKPLEPGTVVEFHVLPDSLVRLHGVRFTTDSISGIPWLDHLSCDTCRVSFPLVRISQLRTGSPGSTALNILVPFIVVIAGIASIAASWPRD